MNRKDGSQEIGYSCVWTTPSARGPLLSGPDSHSARLTTDDSTPNGRLRHLGMARMGLPCVLRNAHPQDDGQSKNSHRDNRQAKGKVLASKGREGQRSGHSAHPRGASQIACPVRASGAATL